MGFLNMGQQKGALTLDRGGTAVAHAYLDQYGVLEDGGYKPRRTSICISAVDSVAAIQKRLLSETEQ